MKLINVFILVWLVGVYTSACSAQTNNNSTENKISVVGKGVIEKEPDMVTINVSINALKPTLAEAKKSVDEHYATLLEQVKKQNIPDKDIKVIQTLSQSEYEWKDNAREYKGEKLSKRVSIKVTNLEKVSVLMRALVENNISKIDGVAASFSNEQELQQQALVAAANNAKQKAQLLANSLNRTLGKASYINEQNVSFPQPYQNQPRMKMAEASMVDTAPPEMFGTQKIQATVQVTFDLEP